MTVLTALWRRRELSALVMRYYASLGMKGVAVKSPGDPQDEVEGWRYVEHPNKPLGAKWNRGMREIDDDVMIVGSDDFVSKDYIDRASALIDEGREIVRCRGLHVLQDGRLVRLETTPGAGRVVCRDMLRRKGDLWDPGRNRYLDADATTKLQPGAPRSNRIDGVVLDVKTDVNLWRLKENQMVSGDKSITYRSGEELDFDVLRDHFPDWVLEEVKALA